MARDVVVRVAPELAFLLPRRDRAAGQRLLRSDPDATAGHLVQAAGVPLTEVGALTLDGAPADRTTRVGPGAVVEVAPVGRPQPLPAGGFLLDVGLGTVARRLRLLGLDAAWSNDADDPSLVARSLAEDRVLLTQDRGLLMRRALAHGALVRGRGPDEQLDDVLDRFAPALAPLTRCTACGGALVAVPKAEVAAELPPGTRRTFDEFCRCATCGRVYWRGAHAHRIDALIDRSTHPGPRLRAGGPAPGRVPAEAAGP